MAEYGEDRLSEVERISDTEVDNNFESDRDELQMTSEEFEQVAEDSARYISNWHDLVSRTNWEKGKIICQWRKKVCEIHEEIKNVSDRAWSRLAGAISPEHVGRLRRTYERFGEVYDNYESLSWTHFMVATSWDDAEMWLEGASQNRWTIDQMRQTRWESMGAVESKRPRKEEVIVEEIAATETERAVNQDDGDVISGPFHEGPDWGEPDTGNETQSSTELFESVEKVLGAAPQAYVDAYNQFAEAIQQSQDENWKSFKRRSAFKLINHLKQLIRE